MRVTRLFSRSLLSLAAGATALTPVIASAQVQQQGAPQIAAANVMQAAPNERTPTAIVNGEIITGTDVEQRMALVLAANEGTVPPEQVAMLRRQTLENLVEETLQIQEARAQELEVSRDQVEQRYAQIAAQNFGQDTAAVDAYLRENGSSPASLKRQIEGQLAWNQLLRRNVAPFVTVSGEEVNELIARMQAERGTEEYHVAEIFLQATPQDEAQVFQTAQAIMQQLREGGGSFAAYAVQYSDASTAAVGGDLGWVKLGQLPAQLSQAARAMQPGQLNGPIQLPGGFSLLYLVDKRQVLTASARDAVLSLKQISISFPEGVTQEAATARLTAFNQAVSQMNGCANADTVAAGIGAEVISNEALPVRNLPAPMQEIVLALQPGQTTEPAGTVADGVRVLMLCDKQLPQAASVDFDTLMGQLEDERINQRAQRYLRDLRRDAIIEYR